MKADSNESFSFDQVPVLLEDLLVAGYESTTSTLRWGFLMMYLYPDIQRNFQEELDAVVSRSTIVRPSDKLNLPYVKATLQEVFCYGSVAAGGLSHSAAEDTTLGSYDIAKGTTFTANLRFIRHNPDWWETLEEFNPQFFLTSEGVLKKSSEYLLPFSLGKRRYPGEALAEDQVYILFTALLHNFELRLDGDKLVDLRPLGRIAADTRPHKILCIPRV